MGRILVIDDEEKLRNLLARIIGLEGFEVIEAVFLSFIGGIIGVGLGLGVSGIVSGMMKWPVTISINAIVLSFICSTVTGIFFGWYPARKAANLNPIEALRYE